MPPPTYARRVESAGTVPYEWHHTTSRHTTTTVVVVAASAAYSAVAVSVVAEVGSVDGPTRRSPAVASSPAPTDVVSAPTAAAPATAVAPMASHAVAYLDALKGRVLSPLWTAVCSWRAGINDSGVITAGSTR